MLVLKNVSIMMLTTASNAHKHVAGVLKNVEGWQAAVKTNSSSFFEVDGGFSIAVTTTITSFMKSASELKGILMPL